MIIHKSSKNDLLIPIFLVIISLLSLSTPIRQFIKAQTTNTDTAALTTPKTALKPLSTPEKISTGDISVPILGATTPKSTPTITYQAAAPAPTYSGCQNHDSAPYNAINICGRTIPIQLSAAAIKNATPPNGLAVQHTFYNVLYGHNSYDVFGGLYGLLAPGNQFAVNINGINITYTVSSIYTINTNEQFADAVSHLRFANRTSSGLSIITCAPGVTYNSYTNTTSSQDRVLILANPVSF